MTPLGRALRQSGVFGPRLVDPGPPDPEPTGPRRRLVTTEADMQAWKEDDAREPREER